MVKQYKKVLLLICFCILPAIVVGLGVWWRNLLLGEIEELPEYGLEVTVLNIEIEEYSDGEITYTVNVKINNIGSTELNVSSSDFYIVTKDNQTITSTWIVSSFLEELQGGTWILGEVAFYTYEVYDTDLDKLVFEKEIPFSEGIHFEWKISGLEVLRANLPLLYTYNIVNVYPHDKDAFTQGLVFEDGVLYEGTGLYGYSTLRRVELETGEVLQLYALPDQFFGEGITIFNDKIIQLTWRSNKGFIYDKYSFDLLQEFDYPTEGWGITHNGSCLIMSDGTATLYFLNPETFENVGQIEVHDIDPVTKLNELEYIQGEIYANIWLEEKIAIINPQTGQVKGWIDLKGIQDISYNVLNGIAYDVEEGRLFVTGKNWSELFEIELILLE